MTTIKPQDNITFGGVRVNQNEVASKKIINENGQKKYIINFKNGSTIKYPQQNSNQGAHIENDSYINPGAGRIFRERDVQEVNITRIFGAEFTGSNKRDQINLNGCKDCKIDISNDNTTDEVTIEDSLFESKNNLIKQGSQDYTNIFTRGRDYKTGIQVLGKGIHRQGNE